MITLYAYPARFGVPSSSPFVMKTHMHLKMAGLDHRVDFDGADRAPKGKLPYIDDDGTIVADSTFIRLYLERKYDFDFDVGYDEREKALARTVERMAEDNLFWLMVHARWADDANFEKGPARTFDRLGPDVRDRLRDAMRSQVLGYLDGQGTGRLSAEEITSLAEKSYAALSQLLGDKPFVLGDRPCGADAGIAAQVISALTPFFASPVRDAAVRHANVKVYADRMLALYFPDFVSPESRS